MVVLRCGLLHLQCLKRKIQCWRTCFQAYKAVYLPVTVEYPTTGIRALSSFLSWGDLMTLYPLWSALCPEMGPVTLSGGQERVGSRENSVSGLCSNTEAPPLALGPAQERDRDSTRFAFSQLFLLAEARRFPRDCGVFFWQCSA